MLRILKELRLENRYSNVVFVQVSMDKYINEWYECEKNVNWLEFPFFPIKPRMALFKEFNVDRLPFMVSLVKDEPPHVFSKDIFKDLFNNKSTSLTNELTYYQEHYCDLDDYILV